MDIIRKTADRAQQSVLETVGSASKTPLEPELLDRLKMADEIRLHSEKLLAAMLRYIPSDPRLTASFTNATHAADGVAHAMKAFADAAEHWPETEHKNAGIRAFRAGQDVFKTLCRSEKSYVENAAIHFLAPMKMFEQFLSADVKRLDSERKELMIARVDMDCARNRAAKSEEAQAEAARAASTFMKQKDIVEEEILNLERKFGLVCSALRTYVNDHVAHLESSLAAIKQLQAVMNAREERGGREVKLESSPALDANV